MYDDHYMAILDPISPRTVLLLLLVLSVPYASAQITPPLDNQTKANDPVVIVITVMFFVIIVMVVGSIFCRKQNLPFYTRPSVLRSTDTNSEARVVRIRNSAPGIEADVIETFPTFIFSEVKAVRIGKGGVECAVCLCEFEDDETLRLMPPCCHVFHADCVDVWLSDHTTCPLCRANLVLKQGEESGGESHLVPDPSTISSGSDPEREMVNVESSDANLLNDVMWTNNSTTPRSKSTGLSSWRITGILFPRSHSTGHSLIQPAENLDRFTLRLPDDVRRQLMKTSLTMRRHVALLPETRSPRNGYRSGSVGSERRVFSFGRKNNYNNRLHSMSFSFSLRTGSLRSTFSGDVPKHFPTSIDSGERSFERLRPDDRV